MGPTLGTAMILAVRGENLGHVAVVMGTFGLGAALPLLALGLLSQKAMLRWCGRMLSAGSGMKAALGVLLLTAGVLVLTGFDKVLEAAMVSSAPSAIPAARSPAPPAKLRIVLLASSLARCVYERSIGMPHSPELGRVAVLVVEDEPLVRMDIVDQLADEG